MHLRILVILFNSVRESGIMFVITLDLQNLIKFVCVFSEVGVRQEAANRCREVHLLLEDLQRWEEGLCKDLPTSA